MSKKPPLKLAEEKAVLEKLKNMGLAVEDRDEEIVALIASGVAVKNFQTDFDFEGWVIRQLIVFSQIAKSERLRLGAIELIMRMKGLVQIGMHSGTNPIKGKFNDETAEVEKVDTIKAVEPPPASAAGA